MKKISKFIKSNYKFLIGVIVGLLLSGTGVYAANTIYSSNVTYDNSNSGLSATNVQDALDETYTRCFPQPKLGDYISLTPTTTTYIVKPGSWLETILNPQELNIWRVISINEDGTLDIISENVSSETISFYGASDYRKYVNTLNTIASKYENSNYTIGSRYFGYNGQIETLSSIKGGMPPWDCSTNESCSPSEIEGGGDMLYERDYNLVKEALGTLEATIAGSNTKTLDYFTASRYYYYSSNSYWSFGGRKASLSYDGTGMYDYAANAYESSVDSGYIRPILILKANLKYTEGTGTKNDPYTLD